MEEIKTLLHQIIANQVILYKRIEDVEYKVKGGSRLASLTSYSDELKAKANEVISKIKNDYRDD